MSKIIEKPPFLKGSTQDQVTMLRDYMFRLAKSLDDVISATASESTAAGGGKSGAVPAGGGTGGSGSSTADEIRKNANELRSLIIKSAENMRSEMSEGDESVISYVDNKTEEYNSLYVARSEYGEFQETINTTIENTAKGVVESYGYGSAIESVQSDIGLLQNYYTSINGEIRRGIVQDPDTGDYVTGIAISQSLQFSGECGPSDPLNPGDGYVYYYLNQGQTFGLYTSTGWQFWIDGVKRGWFNSEDGMLHVKNVYVDNILHIGANWTIRQSGNSLLIDYVE